MTVGFSISSTLREAIFFWAVNGLGLSLVIPNVQVSIQACRPSCQPSITGDYSWGKAIQLVKTTVYLDCAHGSMMT